MSRHLLAIPALVLGLFLMPTAAHAQIIGVYGFGGFGRPWYPPVTSPYYGGNLYPQTSSWGYGGWPGYSSYSPGYGYGGFPSGSGGYPMGYGAFPMGYGGYFPMRYSATQTVILPGFSASGYANAGARFRDTISPAVAVAADSPLLAAASLPSPDPVHTHTTLQVLVPTADAELWLDGVRLSKTGSSRIFITPPLSSNKTYTYEVRIRWHEGGAALTRTKTVSFNGGESIQVDMTIP